MRTNRMYMGSYNHPHHHTHQQWGAASVCLRRAGQAVCSGQWWDCWCGCGWAVHACGWCGPPAVVSAEARCVREPGKHISGQLPSQDKGSSLSTRPHNSSTRLHTAAEGVQLHRSPSIYDILIYNILCTQLPSFSTFFLWLPRLAYMIVCSAYL